MKTNDTAQKRTPVDDITMHLLPVLRIIVFADVWMKIL